MCMLISNVEGKQYPDGWIDRFAKENPDGIGVYWLDTQLRARNISLKAFKRGAAKGRPHVVHFRYATVGDKNSVDNMHPHRIDKRHYLFHNGTIKNLGKDKSSDTAHMAKLLAKSDKSIWSDLLNYVGAPCRFIVVDRETNKLHYYGPLKDPKSTNTYYVDKDKWHVIDGVGYSKNPEPYQTPVYNNNYRGRGTGAANSRRLGTFSKVFVYGTLKKGGKLASTLSTSRFFGEAKTSPGYTLLDGAGFPYMFKTKNNQGQVIGELYEVNESTLETLDRIEGHPNHYTRTNVQVVCKGITYFCQTYLAGSRVPWPKDTYGIQQWPEKSVLCKSSKKPASEQKRQLTTAIEKLESLPDEEYFALMETAHSLCISLNLGGSLNSHCSKCNTRRENQPELDLSLCNCETRKLLIALSEDSPSQDVLNRLI